MGKVYKGYLYCGNSWGDVITNVQFWHQKDGSPQDLGHESKLNSGEISAQVPFLAEDGVHDNWGVVFTDSEKTTWRAEFKNAGFKTEDADGIIFMTVTKDDKEAHLYFPVSDDEDEDLERG